MKKGSFNYFFSLLYPKLTVMKAMNSNDGIRCPLRHYWSD